MLNNAPVLLVHVYKKNEKHEINKAFIETVFVYSLEQRDNANSLVDNLTITTLLSLLQNTSYYCFFFILTIYFGTNDN